MHKMESVQQVAETFRRGYEALFSLFTVGVPVFEAAAQGIPNGYNVRNLGNGDNQNDFNTLEWYVMREMRSGSGNRDSMPRDYNYSSAGRGSSGSYQVLRPKGEMAWILAWRGAAFFGILGGVFWILGWPVCRHLGWDVGGSLQGTIGGALAGIVGGVIVGFTKRDHQFKGIIVGMSGLGVLGVILGALIGGSAGFFGVWWAWPLVGAVLGAVIGAGIGLAKGD